jgi:short-subunit dehydrogenase
MSNRDKYGPWAVITGASDGIGRAIAQRAAADGLNVALAARSAAKLHELAAELAQAHGVQTHVVPVDLSQPSGATTLLDAVDDHDVGLAVLAAGFGTNGPLAESPIADELEMIGVNVTAVAQLAHTFARRMTAQKRGGIVLFGSVLGWQGVPGQANYAATKAYVQSLAEGLHGEVKPHGVDVLCVAPGPVHTGFATRAGMTMKSAATPDQVADAAWSALGHRVTVVPGLQAKFMTTSLKMLPRYVRSTLLSRVMASMRA